MPAFVFAASLEASCLAGAFFRRFAAFCGFWVRWGVCPGQFRDGDFGELSLVDEVEAGQRALKVGMVDVAVVAFPAKFEVVPNVVERLLDAPLDGCVSCVL